MIHVDPSRTGGGLYNTQHAFRTSTPFDSCDDDPDASAPVSPSPARADSAESEGLPASGTPWPDPVGPSPPWPVPSGPSPPWPVPAGPSPPWPVPVGPSPPSSSAVSLPSSSLPGKPRSLVTPSPGAPSLREAEAVSIATPMAPAADGGEVEAEPGAWTLAWVTPSPAVRSSVGS